MKKYILYFIYLFIALLPSAAKRFVLNRFLGHEIHETARIGFSFIYAKKIIMGPHAHIRDYCFIRNLELLSLGEGSTIGSHNRIDSLPLTNTRQFQNQNRFPALIVGKNSHLVGNHYFDCNNTIYIGDYTIIAGRDSIFFTHGINIKKNKQESEKISIGSHCMVATRCVVLKGASLPDCSVLGANSMLHKAFEASYTLYSGVPAIPVKPLDPSCEYFLRNTEFVS